MYFQILKDCSEPYFVLLRKWIEFGIVQDPYDEFQIRVRLRNGAMGSDLIVFVGS